MAAIVPSRRTTVLVSVTALAIALVPFAPAHATNFSPGCSVTNLTGNIGTANINNLQSDIIDLAAGCIYHMGATITVLPDGSHSLTIRGHGATMAGSGNAPVFKVNPGANLILEDVIVEGGFSTSDGGGIVNKGTLSLTTAVVSDSDAARGGGIFNAGGTVTLTNSEVARNSATLEAGGIFNDVGGTVKLLSNSTVTDNDAVANSAGGILTLGKLVVDASHISDNVAPAGGGILSYGQIFLQNGASVANNVASGNGGGIYNGNYLSIDHSTVSDNIAHLHGGGVYTFRQVDLTYSVLSNNRAETGAGGGVFLDGPFYGSGSAKLNLDHSRLAHNRAPAGDGGGVYNLQGIVKAQTSDVAHNVAAKEGGGIFNAAASTTNLLSNSTVKYNSATGGGGLFNRGTIGVNHSHVSRNVAGGNGGGALNHGRITMSNLSGLSGNVAAVGGGAYNDNFLNILSSNVLGNKANKGGGAYSTSTIGDIRVTSSTVSNNRATQGNGGGVANLSGSFLRVSSAVMGANSAVSAGGGIYNSAARVRVTGSVLETNAASTGGGIANESQATIDTTTFERNTASSSLEGGGGIFNAGPTTQDPALLTVDRATFVGNTATPGFGGGILNGRPIIVATGSPGAGFGQATLTNVTMTQNSAQYGGAIFSELKLTINNATIAKNAGGGGIFANASNATASNSIVTNNVGGDCPLTLSGSFNLSSVAGCGSGFSVGTPNLGLLADNGGALTASGGATKTMELLPGSAAIDTAGPLSSCRSLDQRDRVRVDGDGDSIIECDKGAYEFMGTTPGGGGGGCNPPCTRPSDLRSSPDSLRPIRTKGRRARS